MLLILSWKDSGSVLVTGQELGEFEVTWGKSSSPQAKGQNSVLKSVPGRRTEGPVGREQAHWTCPWTSQGLKRNDPLPNCRLNMSQTLGNMFSFFLSCFVGAYTTRRKYNYIFFVLSGYWTGTRHILGKRFTTELPPIPENTNLKHK